MLTYSELPNGLKLCFEQNPHVHSVAMGFLVLAGSRHEPAALSGVSHAVEHLCFKGNRRRTAEELAWEVDHIGAQWNGSTSWEATSYYLWAPSEKRAAALDLLADLVRPVFRKEDFELEKQVILEELAMYEDTPDERVLDELFEAAYEGHPMSQRMMGTEETVTRLTRAQAADYHRVHYRPGRMLFVAVGSFEPEEMARLVGSKCGRWRRAAGPEAPQRPRFRSRRRVVRTDRFARGYLTLAVPAPPRGSRLAPLAALLASYLGSEDNSRLFWSVREKGLADEVWADYEGFSDGGLLYCYAAADPANIERTRTLIEEELARLHTDLDSALFRRARTKLLTDAVCERESPLERLENVMSSLAAGAEPMAVEEEIAEYERLTPEDVSRYLRKFPTNRGTACAIMNGSGDAPD